MRILPTANHTWGDCEQVKSTTTHLATDEAKPLDVPVDVGDGNAVVLLHGFGMRPRTYLRTARILAERTRVVIPDLFAVHGHWVYEDVLGALRAALDDLGLQRVTLIGHSFGGALELGFAAAHPERVVELVFSDTLAVSAEWSLADEAMRHPLGLLRLATPLAASSFGVTALRHGRQLADAGWWAFRSERRDDIRIVAEHGLRAHVMWANRDSILSRRDGREFARDLRASFTVATAPGNRTIDHDWMFQQPELFVDHLQRLRLKAFDSH